jgi:hypothetical protein
MGLGISCRADGSLAISDQTGETIARLSTPGELETLTGDRVALTYSSTTLPLSGATVNAAAATSRVSADGGVVNVTVTDEWTVDEGGILLVRRWAVDASPASEVSEVMPGLDAAGVSGFPEAAHHAAGHATGIRLALSLELPSGSGRFVAPGMMYSPGQWADGGLFSFADERLAYPIVARYDEATRRVVSLARVGVALFDESPTRVAGDQRFAQATDIGSVGFATGGTASNTGRTDTLAASWPYQEADRSSMLDAAGSSATAFFPASEGSTGTLRYRITSSPAEDYDAAVRVVVDTAMALAEPTPTALPVSYEESIDLRLDSAEKTFFFDKGFAGFRLNFDPEIGYHAQAKAFGASFADHAMGGSHDVLEYGFTGRQLNLAFLLAERNPEQWADRGAAVVESFVRELATASGFVHTLWNVSESRPLCAVGDPAGPVMHYLGRSDVAGTYTRMMAEAGTDLLLNIELHRSLGSDVSSWFAAADALGKFFLRVQNPDGSWFRAYAPDETSIADSEWFGYRDHTAKSATGTVVPFLAALATAMGDGAFLDAAERAVRFELDNHVRTAEYRGGTLDNPNLVDKEAAFIAMKALLAVAEQLPEDSAERAAYLDGARRAADTAISWHSLWEVPNIPGTPVAAAAVRSVGWGGINSVWGVGVTDIYSLFFAGDLGRLASILGDARYAEFAELIAASSLQLLAVPDQLHGFADTGMQPEGISFCPQGADDGLITKGAIWGGLGWPYTAGTFGLREYLRTVPDISSAVA